MNVSPIDLRQQRFATSLRGFDKIEVTSFLLAVADDYETALRETDRLRQDLSRMEAILNEHREQALHARRLSGRGGHGNNTITSATQAGRSSPSISYVRVNTDSTPEVFCCALITVTAARIWAPTLTGDGNRTLLSP